ncbi:MAG TPA: ATPase domain-containing protein [Thermomicrobiales bacterium]|nr:ATPase domain-containing protein [Thermomicrobiales bacterium]
MVRNDASTNGPGLRRLPSRVPGLDAVLGGGLMVGDTYLIAGTPGTGKTTLGNQLAFARAAMGSSVLFATLLTESHDRMLAHLEGFQFFDRALVGERIHYLSLLGVLQEEGVEGVMHTVLTTVRSHQASLLIIDGAGVARMLTGSDFDYARFIHGLQARTALLGCTTLLLAGEREADPVATHVDGVIQLANEPAQARDARSLRVVKLRGSDYLNGRHRFAIGDAGITVFPRLEAAHARTEPTWHEPDERLTFGIPGLDTMTGGGLPAGSVTVVLGTPGAGKTLLGLHFLSEGASRGEPGLIATFHETAAALSSTAERAGMNLGSYLDTGLVRVLWRPPLELAPDEWAWQMLAVIDEYRPRRLVIDAFSDLVPLFAVPERRIFFTPALAQQLRDRGVTTLINMEIDTFAAPYLISPVQNVSASVDNAVLLRTVELGSSLRRVVSILKERQTGFDPTIREFVIDPRGMVIGDRLDAGGLLTGSATPLPDNA